MELVREGSKQTEVGLIPENWVLKSIEEIAKITTGGSDTQDRVEDGKYPFFVRSEKIETINKYSFNGEAILTSGDGVGVGKIFHYVNGKFDFHQRVYAIYDYNFGVDGRYLFYQFSTNFYQRVMSMTAKSSVDSVRREMIASMLIPLPPTLKEQQAIATALNDVDALISSLDALIAKKKAIKQGAMQQLLTPPSKGGKRLPGFDGEWEEKKLGEVCNINMGQSPLSSNYNTEGKGLPLVQGNADIKKRKTIIRNYTSQITKTADKGDIIMSVRAPVGEIAYSAFKCCIGRGVCAIKFDNEFLYHYLIFKEASWAKFSTGSTFDSINSSQLRSLLIFIPQGEAEQKAIAQILSDMDFELEQLEAKKEKYQQIKQGMMQELLTGKTRLV